MNPLRVAAAITATAAVGLLAAACGGSPSSTGAGSTPNVAGSSNVVSRAISYSRCVRSHGVPDFPYPDSSGQISKHAIRQLNDSASRLQAAQTACQALWPYQPPTPAQQRQELADDLKFAQCMRSHGVPDFPDPTNSDGTVEFVISVSKDGFNPHSPPPRILANARACEHVLPAGSGLPPVTVTS